jgi:periplasmic protein TonB
MNASRIVKLIILLITVGIHVVVIFTITVKTSEKKEREDTTIFKIVDLKEYTPPPPEPEKEEEKKEEKIEVPRQEKVTEEVLETEKEVVTVEEQTPSEESEPRQLPVPEQEEIEYLPQHKISVSPEMPTEEIRKNITYPELARRQKIEGVVFLELYIDQYGEIRNIVVLKDPGYGLAKAALEALKGLTVAPAQANGIPVAVRFRYPIRFSIK